MNITVKHKKEIEIIKRYWSFISKESGTSLVPGHVHCLVLFYECDPGESYPRAGDTNGNMVREPENGGNLQWMKVTLRKTQSQIMVGDDF